MEALIALGSALAFSTGQILVRIGLRYASALSAITISITFTATLVWLTLFPFASLEVAPTEGIFLYLFLGVLSPLITQALLFASALHVGISRASPLRNMAPLFASLLSIAFLGEHWTPSLASGTILIIAGGTLLGMRDMGQR